MFVDRRNEASAMQAAFLEHGSPAVRSSRSAGANFVAAAIMTASLFSVPTTGRSDPPADPAPFVPLLTSDECWQCLPPAVEGSGQPLPTWARAVAVHLPRTAAAMLQVDAAQRIRSPLDPILRAKLRWVIAQANHCEYGQATAITDLRRAGASDEAVVALTGDQEQWP
jgi:hypothetical protein